MANITNIEWADLTINPIIGCSKCSPGCASCYAERWAARLARMPATKKTYSQVMDGNQWNGQTCFNPKCFDSLPQKPARIFVGSMGDVFHETVSQMQIDALFNMMSRWPQHTFMLLTKRAQRMRDMVLDIWERYPNKNPSWILPNVWLGVTAENQEKADERIPLLLSIPAVRRFVSVEPMLETVDLQHWPWCADPNGCDSCNKDCNGNDGFGSGLDWVICGAETGPSPRPMDEKWARSLLAQCKTTYSKIPFFMKQMSGGAPIPSDLMIREIPK